MIGYLASHVGTGIPKEDNNYLLCLFCLVPVSSHRRIQESHTRNEAREIVREALGPGMALATPAGPAAPYHQANNYQSVHANF